MVVFRRRASTIGLRRSRGPVLASGPWPRTGWGRDEPVDDGIPLARWLDPIDAGLWGVHRPPMSSLDPTLRVMNGSYTPFQLGLLVRVPARWVIALASWAPYSDHNGNDATKPHQNDVSLN